MTTRSQHLSLSSFRQNCDTQIQRMFTPVSNYPKFFNYNLQDPCRNILRFSGESCSIAIRVFYYQLFRLFALTSDVMSRDYRQEMYTVVLSNNFLIKCSQKEDQQTLQLNNKMFKPLVKQFFDLMEGGANFHHLIAKHPVLDSILVNLFKTLLREFNVIRTFDQEPSLDVVLEALGKLFDLSVTKIKGCYRFDEADVFCYAENECQLYIAFKGPAQIRTDCLLRIPISSQVNPQRESFGSLCNTTPHKNSSRTKVAVSSCVIQEETSQNEQSRTNGFLSSNESVEEFTDHNTFQQVKQSPIQQMDEVSFDRSELNRLFQPSKQQTPQYYSDFTNTILLEIINQPYRQGIRSLKDRFKSQNVRGPRRGVNTLML